MKPFDFAVLVEALKSKGMVPVEAEVKLITTELFKWISDSCAIHPNPLLKMLPMLIAAVEPEILKLEDKIDGIAGN